MSGEPHFFFLFGRDAWQGIGQMRCQDQEQRELVQAVEVRFQSQRSGFGANQDSQLQLELALAVKKFPLAFESVVRGQAAGGMTHWQYTQTELDFVGRVSSHSPRLTEPSLTQGVLSLRSVPPSVAPDAEP